MNPNWVQIQLEHEHRVAQAERNYQRQQALRLQPEHRIRWPQLHQLLLRIIA